MRRCVQCARLYPFVLETVRWRMCTVNERRRLKDAHFVLVGGSDFARVGAAVECRYPDVVVHSAGNDLNTLEGAREYDNVAACCISLQIDKMKG